MSDCFAPSQAMIPLEEALARLDAHVSPVTGTETVKLVDALGRVLAETVPADRDVPPHDNSAVDGYALFFDDLNAEAETRLPVAGRIAAGHPLPGTPRRGAAYRIFTGAPMPEGMDTVAMQEDCREDGDFVILPAGLKRGANRRKRAEDVTAGTPVLEPGVRLRPQEIGLAASVGRSELRVRTRLRVAVFSTGDEIRDPDGDAPAGCIYDTNRFTVMGLAAELGFAVTDLGILPDRLDAIRDALDAAARTHDVLITSGGVSIGDEDHVKAAVEALGSLHFWRVAIKPGRPIALGSVGDAFFVGLPGNPVAAMVTFLRIARPVLLRLAGRTDTTPARFRVPAGFSHRKKTGRREWLRAWLETGPGGAPVAVKYPSDGSGILTSMVRASGLVELVEDQGPVSPGDPVDFLPFSEMRT